MSVFALPVLGALALGLAQTAPSPVPAGVVVVTLDDARQDQMRYVRSLVEDVDRAVSLREPGLIALRPAALGPEAFDSCIDDLGDGGVRCARYYASRSTDGAAPLVVVLVADGRRDGDRVRPGSAAVRCVGVGAAATDPLAQDITVWPGAPMMHGVRDWMEDRAALAGCIAAAARESR